MDILHIKRLIKEQRKEKKKNAATNLLCDFHKTFSNIDLVDAIQLRMHEIDSFIQVIHASMETDFYDESFYKKQVAGSMHLLKERYDEFQIMIDALIEEKTIEKAPMKAVA